MNIFTQFAAQSTASDAEALATSIFVILFMLIVLAVSYVISSLLYVQIFKKANVASWIGWVPIYNQWKFLEIGGQHGAWILASFVPIPGASIVTLVFQYIAMYHIGKKLGKDGSFLLWGVFIPIVWFVWLAVDDSKWNDAASDAPSLA